MVFNDDEEIVLSQDSGPRPTPIVEGKVQLTSINKSTAPLEKTTFKVLLELTGGSTIEDRIGLDLVAVLDVSGSMGEDVYDANGGVIGTKLEKLKTAMKFVIKKLSPLDRLSIVTFSNDSKRLCKLRQVTEDSQTELEILTNGLIARGRTNMEAGLRTGLQVLNERRITEGRDVGIILMSDGAESKGSKASLVSLGKVPVYTFGFGRGYDPTILTAIADNTIEGTFSDVQNTDDLSIAFSQCLAGLLTVVVQDLQLTVSQIDGESSIGNVSAGTYPQSMDNTVGSVTVTFGALYNKEVRKVIVELLLPASDSERGADVLEISYSYNTVGKPYEAPPAIITVSRNANSADEEERPELLAEESRIRTAKMMKEARLMADRTDFDNAQRKLNEAQSFLSSNKSNPLVDMLLQELGHMLKLMVKEFYEQQGRPYALSSETSHGRQRFTSRGDVKNKRLFRTPRMDKYLEEAMSFDKDPSQPVAPANVDAVKESNANNNINPLDQVAGPLRNYIQDAIQALRAIENLLNSLAP